MVAGYAGGVMGGQFFEILIFAVFAALIIYRLRSVLGRRAGEERPPPDVFSRRRKPPSQTDNIVHLPDQDNRAADSDRLDAEPEAEIARSPLEAGLYEIQNADRNFGAESFLEGARAAFETIVAAYAEGDLSQLKQLLSKDVYENFAEAVQSRYDGRETLETTLVGIKSVALMDAGVENRRALVTVKFVSEQINVTRDRDGKIVDGDADEIAKITDIWTFAREVRARDPNWTLVETSSSN